MNVTFDTYDKCCWDAPEMTFDLEGKPGPENLGFSVFLLHFHQRPLLSGSKDSDEDEPLTTGTVKKPG